MSSSANGPEPRACEAHVAGYAYHARFPALRRHLETEGGAVYVADSPDGHYVVTDESTLADLVDVGDAAIAIYAFDTAADRDAYCARRFAPRRPTIPTDDVHPAPASVAGDHQGPPRPMPNTHSDVRLSYKGRGVPDFPALLQLFGDAEFRSPARSTVPLLAWWRSWDVALAALGDAIGQSLLGPVDLAFEHPVAVQGDGRGPASQTDLLVSTPTHAVAIEAKSTEPSYATVAEWLAGRDDDTNRVRVLSGWLGLINRVVGSKLTVDDVASSTYQLIHRTASACHASATWRAVVYQGFGLRALEHAAYVEQIRRLSALLGRPPQLRFYVLDCSLRPTAAYEALRARWAAGERDLAAEVRAGLLDGHLLERGTCSVTSA